MQAKPLDVPGAELKGVYQGLPFLIQKNVPGALDIPAIDVQGRRVVVLGGGDTAMDCLRTAIRCGAAEAVCLYRRDFANMPGSRKEYQSALEEGAQFNFLTNPVRLLGDAQGQSRASDSSGWNWALPTPAAAANPSPSRVPNSISPPMSFWSPTVSTPCRSLRTATWPDQSNSWGACSSTRIR